MSKRMKAAATMYAGLATSLALPHGEVHAAEITPVYAAPAAESIATPLSGQAVQSEIGKLILPTTLEDPLDAYRSPHRDFRTDPGLLDVVVAHKTAGQKIMYTAEELAYFREQQKLQEVQRLVRAVDYYIEGVSPELTQRGLTYLLLNGYSIYGASAVWGAVIKESKGRTDAYSPLGFKGLFQWNIGLDGISGRYAKVGARPDDTLEVQLGRGVYEMKTDYPAAYAVLTSNNATMPESDEAMHWFEGEANRQDGRRRFSGQIKTSLENAYWENPPLVFVPGRLPEPAQP